ncbi:MAG: hypothetical protein Q9161_002679 [Pseudevernia consocians]
MPVILENKSDKTLKTSGAYLQWGKFYEHPDENKEVSIKTVDNQPIPSKGAFQFASCGRESSPSGTEGQIDIMNGNERIFQLYWDCPWSGDNKLYVKYVAENWYPVVPPVQTSGALGTVTIKVINQGM